MRSRALFEDSDMSFGEFEHEINDIERVKEIYVPRTMLGRKFEMKIRSGCYDLHSPIREERLPNPTTLSIESDEIIENGWSGMIIESVRRFFKSKAFEDNGILHKRGMLVVGPPGSGKSVTMKVVIEAMTRDGNITLLSRSPYVISESLVTFRKMEPHRPILVMMEDLDEIINSWGSREILEMMDGMNTVNHVMFIATTNNPEKLAPKLKRKGRFDEHIKIPNPHFSLRRKYIEQKFKNRLSSDDKTKMAVMSEGMGYGDLRELFLSITGHGMSISKAMKRLVEDKREEQKHLQDRAELMKSWG